MTKFQERHGATQCKLLKGVGTAYIATLLETGQTKVERYNGDPLSIASLEIKSALPNRLSRLKRQSPEAFYYWAKTSELL